MDRYRSVMDLPGWLPVFPLHGCILLPRCSLPLNIFEPRYLEMIDEVLRGDRLVGIVQPFATDEESPTSKNHPLRNVGCVGRLSAYSENDDGRILITLTGVCRFSVAGEQATAKPYRVCDVTYQGYENDLVQGAGQGEVNWERFLNVLKNYLDARKLSADWDAIYKSKSELLVNTLSMISPYGAEEKQALLECKDLKTRAEVLMALAEMEIATTPGSTSGPSLH